MPRAFRRGLSVAPEIDAAEKQEAFGFGATAEIVGQRRDGSFGLGQRLIHGCAHASNAAIHTARDALQRTEPPSPTALYLQLLIVEWRGARLEKQ